MVNFWWPMGPSKRDWMFWLCRPPKRDAVVSNISWKVQWGDRHRICRTEDIQFFLSSYKNPEEPKIWKRNASDLQDEYEERQIAGLRGVMLPIVSSETIVWTKQVKIILSRTKMRCLYEEWRVSGGRFSFKPADAVRRTRTCDGFKW